MKINRPNSCFFSKNCPSLTACCHIIIYVPTLCGICITGSPPIPEKIKRLLFQRFGACHSLGLLWVPTWPTRTWCTSNASIAYMVEKGVQIPKTKSVWEAMNGLIENPKRVRMKQAKTRLAKANSSFSQNNYSGEGDEDDEDVSP